METIITKITIHYYVNNAHQLAQVAHLIQVAQNAWVLMFLLTVIVQITQPFLHVEFQTVDTAWHQTIVRLVSYPTIFWYPIPQQTLQLWIVVVLVHVQVDIMSQVEIVPSAIQLVLNVIKELMIVQNVLMDFICFLTDAGLYVRLVTTQIYPQIHVINVIPLVFIVSILLYAITVWVATTYTKENA